jgi:hypothetical protein
MSASLDQKVQFFDHILGLRDKLTAGSAGSATKKGPETSATAGGGANNVQKRIYRYTPGLAKARFECPIIGDANGSPAFANVLKYAISGEEVSVEMVFWKTSATKVTVSKGIISSFTLSLKAGDIATFSCEVTGAKYESGTGSSGAVDCTKLVTWDRCKVGGDVSAPLASFDLTITNPPVPIYTTTATEWFGTSHGPNGVMPRAIRVGIQEVSGAISMLSAQSLSGEKKITFEVNGVSKTVYVVCLPPSDQANTGQYIQTINFVGSRDSAIWA